MISPKRILVIAEGQLGDALVITPALRALKESLPASTLAILLLYRRKYTEPSSIEHAVIRKSSLKGTAEVFQNNPYVDEVLELDRGAMRSLKGIKRLKAEVRNIRALRRLKFDTVICTFPQDRFAIYSYLSGAKIRIGQKKQGMSFLLSDKPDADQNVNGVLVYFCKLLGPLGLGCKNYNTVFNIPEADRENAEKFFKENNLDGAKRIIGIHPGSSQHDRKWLPGSYAKLINFIGAVPGTGIILFYSGYDIPYINEIKRNVNVKLIEAKTKSLAELASMLVKCSFCVVHSSGPRHLAAAVGVRTVGIFDKCDDKRWAIYDKTGHPVIKTRVPCKVCPEDRCLGLIPNGEPYSSYCMRDINFDEVVSKVKELIG